MTKEQKKYNREAIAYPIGSIFRGNDLSCVYPFFASVVKGLPRPGVSDFRTSTIGCCCRRALAFFLVFLPQFLLHQSLPFQELILHIVKASTGEG